MRITLFTAAIVGAATAVSLNDAEAALPKPFQLSEVALEVSLLNELEALTEADASAYSESELDFETFKNKMKEAAKPLKKAIGAENATANDVKDAALDVCRTIESITKCAAAPAPLNLSCWSAAKHVADGFCKALHWAEGAFEPEKIKNFFKKNGKVALDAAMHGVEELGSTTINGVRGYQDAVVNGERVIAHGVADATGAIFGK